VSRPPEYARATFLGFMRKGRKKASQKAKVKSQKFGDVKCVRKLGLCGGVEVTSFR
jgi:hypothetical protein